jgi:hypothetical protein
MVNARRNSGPSYPDLVCRGRWEQSAIEQRFELPEAGRSDQEYVRGRTTEHFACHKDRRLLPGTVFEPTVRDLVACMHSGCLEEFAVRRVDRGLKVAIHEHVP